MTKFLRRDCARFSKFGKGNGKKAKWRSPKGRDNKMREGRKGYQSLVSVGYKAKNSSRGLLNEKTPVTIMNTNDLKKIVEGKIGIVGKIGTKNKIEIVKKAKELKVELKNINIEAFLKKINKKEKKNESKK